MKKIFNILIATVLMSTLFLASCATDETEEPTPTTTDAREKFHGNWSVSENSTDFGTSTYNCTITDSSVSPYIFIAYLYGFNKKIYSSVSGNNITIPVQTIQGQNVSGNGTLVNADQINLTYYVRTTSVHYDTITATLTK
jgi:hypothetical protein